MTVRDKSKARGARAPGKADSKALALYRLRLVGRGVLRADDALRRGQNEEARYNIDQLLAEAFAGLKAIYRLCGDEIDTTFGIVLKSPEPDPEARRQCH